MQKETCQIINDTLIKLTIPAKAKIQIKKIGRTDGYDGHSLRAYSYFKDQMPDLPLEDQDRYIVKVGATDICFTEKDTVTYKNQALTGKEFYERYINNQL